MYLSGLAVFAAHTGRGGKLARSTARHRTGDHRPGRHQPAGPRRRSEFRPLRHNGPPRAGLHFETDGRRRPVTLARRCTTTAFPPWRWRNLTGRWTIRGWEPALQKAVRLIVSAQEENSLHAWRYSPEARDADTTVSGAQMVALLAARNAGIPVPEHAIQNGLDFFLSCQTADGGIGYISPVAPNATRTAIGCVVLALAKEKNSRRLQGRLQLPENRAAGLPISAVFSLLRVAGVFPRLAGGVAKLEPRKHPVPARHANAGRQLGRTVWPDLRHGRLAAVAGAQLPLSPDL